MEVLDWGTKYTETTCKVSHYIGHISDPSCDIQAAIEEYELHDEFPTKVLEEANALEATITPADLNEREDFRENVTITIDPDTAKDFDDALTITKDKNGVYHLGVHIADVSHYVKLNSAIDAHAKERCNSTYFPNFCLPMLPPILSENLCSLRPDVDRLTISVLMDFDSEGNLLNYRIVKSIIKSAKRFTYKEAKAILDKKEKSPFLKMLQLMEELCLLLKRKRQERGSVEFALPELIILIDEGGVPKGTDYIEYDITHQLVEEFMLKANEQVATHLANQGKNLTYRVHDEPAEENLREFAVLANAFGFKLADTPTPLEMQDLFDKAMKTPYGQYLATSYIRRMRLAIYSAENIGHYGLGLTHYCHFTSPIRRYVDLVIHRIIFGETDDLQQLQMIAAKSSEQERISAKAESHVLLLKKLRLLKKNKEESPFRQYEAVVTRVKNFGLYFEVLELMLESFFHVSDLANDFFVFEEKQYQLRGIHHGTVYRPGDRIIVMLRDVDLISLESNWNLVSEEKKPMHRPKHEKKQAKKSKKRRGKAKKPKEAHSLIDFIKPRRKTSIVEKLTEHMKKR
jgi:ribonuclease R